MISGDSLRTTKSASAAISSSAGRVFGAPGIVRILLPGVQSWIIVSMGMSRNAGPCGTRCANSPALTNCSYSVCGLVARPLHLVNALANRSGPPTTLRLRYHCACGSISRILAVADRLAGAQQHRDLSHHGPLDAHAPCSRPTPAWSSTACILPVTRV